MKASWKTSLCGILAVVGVTIPQFFPEFSRYGLFLSSVATGLGLMFARDNGVTSEQAGAKEDKQGRLPLTLISGLLIATIFFTGCSFVRVSDPQSGHVVINAAVPAWPWQDSTRTIQGLTATSRTNYFAAKVSGLSESETTSTNATAMVQSIVGAAVSAAMKAAP